MGHLRMTVHKDVTTAPFIRSQKWGWTELRVGTQSPAQPPEGTEQA